MCYILCRGPRFEGDRPRFGDREGYRGAPRGGPPGEFGGEKGGAPPEFQPSFRVSLTIANIYVEYFILQLLYCISLL